MKLTYRKMNPTDFEAIAAMLINPEIVKAWNITFTLPDVSAWIERQKIRYQDRDLGYFLAINPLTQQIVGQGGITIQHVSGEAIYEIGCIVNPKFWNQGYASQMVKDFLEIAKTKYRLKTVYALIKTDNYASKKVFLKNHFEKTHSIFKEYDGLSIEHDVFKKDF
ncbi:GNAT family N-acetyltransferase [Mesoplasma seiffertii]|uniref:GNAT family N-acetyltransferase n=1 Tax=Mesoplasma seiffertii TaxID=28224 RepID=UPI00047B80E8|nr:GNAT family N-acetyltransferase [Mesoplasma seiffertii]